MSARAPVRSRPDAPRPPVDPRVRARWIAARRAEGRRRLRVLVAVASVLGTLGIAWAVTVSPLLGVDKVVVRGAQHLSAADVQQAGGVHDGDSMVWMDPGVVTARIEASPWVRTAKVTRDFPRTLVVDITERIPAAWVGAGDHSLVVDGSGRVLEDTPTPPANLPELVGVHGADPGRTIAPSAGARIATGYGIYAAGVTRIELHDGDATVTLRSGTQVRMGPPTRIHAKIVAAGAVLVALGPNAPQYVDVSVPTNPVAG